MAGINGTSGADTLNGTTLGDTMHGYGGNDIINGNAGNDFIYGGGGKDTLNGGPGNDTLHGNAGADTFLFQPGDGEDVISDLGSTDIVLLSGFTTALSIIRSGTDVVVTFSPYDKITFTSTSVSTVQAGLHFSSDGGGGGGGGGGAGTITGTTANDVLTGTSGNDVIYGLAGDDTLTGGAGNDTIYGGNGDDWIRATAGDGADQIFGDLGSDNIELNAGDVLHYSSYQQSGAGYGYDTPHAEYSSAPWTIDFTGFDANLLLAGQQKLVFIGTNANPGTGQLAVIPGTDFLHIPLGLGANLDGDAALEFFVPYTLEFQSTPTFIF